MRLKVLEAVEKARVALSADNEARLIIEQIGAEEEDWEQDITLDEFNNTIEQQRIKLGTVLERVVEALSKQGINVADIDSVELVGDTTRTTIFMEMIKGIFEKENLSRTLHSVNWLAKGAGVYAQIQSGLMSNNQFTLEIESKDTEIDHASKLDSDLRRLRAKEDELSVYDSEVQNVLKFSYDLKQKSEMELYQEHKTQRDALEKAKDALDKVKRSGEQDSELLQTKSMMSGEIRKLLSTLQINMIERKQLEYEKQIKKKETRT